MKADEINAGLAEYMGYRCEPTFTDSLDACESVADKLGVSYVGISQGEPVVSTVLIVHRTYTQPGPTRAHAWAAALWAAVKEAKE